MVSGGALSLLVPLGVTSKFVLSVLSRPISWGSGPSCQAHRTWDIFGVHAWLCMQRLPRAAGWLEEQVGAIEVLEKSCPMDRPCKT